MASLPQPNPAPDGRRSGRHRPDRVTNHRTAWWHPFPPASRSFPRHLARPDQEETS